MKIETAEQAEEALAKLILEDWRRDIARAARILGSLPLPTRREQARKIRRLLRTKRTGEAQRMILARLEAAQKVAERGEQAEPAPDAEG